MKRKIGLTALAGVGFAAIGLASAWAKRSPSSADDSPHRDLRKNRIGAHVITGRTVTITKPDRAQLFAFWRDFTNLPAFMDDLEKVEKADKGWRWTIKAPGGGTVDVITEIVEERDGKLIAWRSVEGSDIETTGRVTFADAPGDRGTEVALVVGYKPPAGRVGQVVAKLLQREPEIQARRNLRRFRMLMETGEIATSSNQLEEAA